MLNPTAGGRCCSCLKENSRRIMQAAFPERMQEWDSSDVWQCNTLCFPCLPASQISLGFELLDRFKRASCRFALSKQSIYFLPVAQHLDIGMVDFWIRNVRRALRADDGCISSSSRSSSSARATFGPPKKMSSSNKKAAAATMHHVPFDGKTMDGLTYAGVVGDASAAAAATKSKEFARIAASFAAEPEATIKAAFLAARAWLDKFEQHATEETQWSVVLETNDHWIYCKTADISVYVFDGESGELLTERDLYAPATRERAAAFVERHTSNGYANFLLLLDDGDDHGSMIEYMTRVYRTNNRRDRAQKRKLRQAQQQRVWPACTEMLEKFIHDKSQVVETFAMLVHSRTVQPLKVGFVQHKEADVFSERAPQPHAPGDEDVKQDAALITTALTSPLEFGALHLHDFKQKSTATLPHGANAFLRDVASKCVKYRSSACHGWIEPHYIVAIQGPVPEGAHHENGLLSWHSMQQHNFPLPLDFVRLYKTKSKTQVGSCVITAVGMWFVVLTDAAKKRHHLSLPDARKETERQLEEDLRGDDNEAYDVLGYKRRTIRSSTTSKSVASRHKNVALATPATAPPQLPDLVAKYTKVVASYGFLLWLIPYPSGASS
jgi:hypothetical protein